WISNLAISRDTINNNITGVSYQYYGGESSISVFNPAFIWSDNCPTSTATDYDPRHRPWYVSATSAQKNIILIFDLSATLPDTTGDRLRRMKLSASLILNGLSYRDFVGIVTYANYGSSYVP